MTPIKTHSSPSCEVGSKEHCPHVTDEKLEGQGRLDGLRLSHLLLHGVDVISWFHEATGCQRLGSDLFLLAQRFLTFSVFPLHTFPDSTFYNAHLALLLCHPFLHEIGLVVLPG